MKGKVTRLMDFGAFVELEPGIEGLVHISELSPNRVRRVADIVKPEQEVEVRILKIEPEAQEDLALASPLAQSRGARARRGGGRRHRRRPSRSARSRSRGDSATGTRIRFPSPDAAMRAKATLKKSGRLGVPEHQVEVLHGHPGRSLDQVIEAGQDQDLAADDAEGDVAEVGEGRILGRRQVADDPDERARGVEGAVEVEQVVLGDRALRAWRRWWRRCRGPSGRGAG